MATTLAHPKGGQFVAHARALPGNPYDGHTLETVIPDMEALIGNTMERILADKVLFGVQFWTPIDTHKLDQP